MFCCEWKVTEMLKLLDAIKTINLTDIERSRHHKYLVGLYLLFRFHFLRCLLLLLLLGWGPSSWLPVIARLRLELGLRC